MTETFLNANFQSLDDLKKVDSLISSIEAERSTAHQDSVNKNQSYNAASTLINDLSTAISNNDYSQVNKIAAEYQGANSALLSKLYHDSKKLMVLKKRQALNDQFKQLESNIENFNSKNEYDLFKLSDKIKLFEKQCDFDPDFDCHAKCLNLQLANLIQTIFKPIQQQEFTLLIKKWDDEKTIYNKGDIKLINEKFSELVGLQQLSSIPLVYPDSYWSLESFAENFGVKFIFHFESVNETNRLDKPEFFLNYLNDYYLKTLPLLKNLIKKRTIDNKRIEYWYFQALLKPIRGKFDLNKSSYLSLIIDNPNDYLLNHLIDELMKFDSKLRKNFKFVNDESIDLTYDLVLKDETFLEKWLDNVGKFVDNRFNELTSNDSDIKIDFESNEIGLTKPTNLSMNFKNLFETITKLYENLTINKFKYKILSEYQLTLLNKFYSIIKNKFSNDKDDKFENIVKYWCTTKFTIECMKSWSESLNFIELGTSLKQDSNQLDLSITFFDPIIKGYEQDILNKLITKSLTVHFERVVNKMMKPIYQAIINDEAKSINMGNLIRVLSNNLHFLKITISKVDLIMFKSELTVIICEYFKYNIIKSFRLKKNIAVALAESFEVLVSQLGLVKDTENYESVIEMLKVFTDDEIVYDHYKVLSADEIQKLEIRRV